MDLQAQSGAISQDQEEEQEKLKANEARDYIKERKNENRSLFSTSTPSKINIAIKSEVSPVPEENDKENTFQEIYPGRKR
ncbi:hypothetical protein [Elizabethkingia anophelis]|uniref:hypothetical protein n=1 Tax=Elizabethkingia anophelis TaxID=1117645 RepID=UPI0032084B6B